MGEGAERVQELRADIKRERAVQPALHLSAAF
jgi:hypothetical protein